MTITEHGPFCAREGCGRPMLKRDINLGLCIPCQWELRETGRLNDWKWDRYLLNRFQILESVGLVFGHRSNEFDAALDRWREAA